MPIISVLFFAIFGYGLAVETVLATSSSTTYSIVETSSLSTLGSSITTESSTATFESADNNSTSTIAQTLAPTTVAPRKKNEPDSRERYLDEIRNNWMKKKWRREWSRNQMKLMEERRLKEKEKLTTKI